MKWKFPLIIATLLIGFFMATKSHAETLQYAIGHTIKTAPDMLIETTDRLAKDHEIEIARAGYFPALDLLLGYGREKSKNPTLFNAGIDDRTLWREEASLILRQMIFDGFATPSEVKRNRGKVEAQAYHVNSTSQDIALRVTEVYIDVLRREELLVIAEANIGKHKEIYDMINKRTDSGLARKSDLYQAEGRLALARANMQTATGNLLDANTRYVRVVGREPVDLVKPEFTTDIFPQTDEEAESLAEQNHPQLKSAEADVLEAEGQHGTAKSAYYPRLDLFVGTDQNRNLDGLKGENDSYYVMGRVNWNLFNGGADHARVKETAHLIAQAREICYRTHRQVIENVNFAWNTLITKRIQLTSFKIHRDSSIKTEEAFHKQFTLGQRTLLDLLDSENELFSSSTTYSSAQHDELFAQFRVLNGIGKLLEVLGLAMPTEATDIGMLDEHLADMATQEKEAQAKAK